MNLNRSTLNNSITWSYFLIALFEIVYYFVYNKVLIFSGIVIPILLMFLYFFNSKKQNKLFYLIFVCLLVENLSFLYSGSTVSFLTIISPIFQKIILIVLVLTLIREKKYLYLSVISILLLLIFIYLFSATRELSEIKFKTLILQSILVSILTGISLSSYIVNDNRLNSWLLISTLLFIGLRFMLFIESYYLTDFTLPVINPIIIILNVFAYFTFYKFVIEAEVEVTDKE